ncbi:hypothetical protein Salat_2315200 [Sesamum alatum]|uniref:Uncharacterized protein n=1 Tax=Sesamum alatum TaxID=300844 RepID=A0AAE1XWS7_9LAMI|nr:hypothetical protein Salat_2315200 [Sesamum alatum]
MEKTFRSFYLHGFMEGHTDFHDFTRYISNLISKVSSHNLQGIYRIPQNSEDLVVIVLLAMLSFLWLKLLEHRVSTLRMIRAVQIYGYTIDGRDTNDTSRVEIYGGTVTAPSHSANRGDSIQDA